MSKILVVDDSETIQLLLKNVLTDHGFGMVSAWSAEEAMKTLMGFRPDLILLDVKLPDIDGFELCRLLRKQPSNKMVPIIMITGTAIDAKQKAQGLRDGADDYLSKPFEPEELIERIRAVLRRVGHSAPDPSAATTPFSGLLRDTASAPAAPSIPVPPAAAPAPIVPPTLPPIPAPATPPPSLFPPRSSPLPIPPVTPAPKPAPTRVPFQMPPATPPSTPSPASKPAPLPISMPPVLKPTPAPVPTAKPIPTPPTPVMPAAQAPATPTPPARVTPLPAFDPYDRVPSEHARGIGESLLAALCAPQRLPEELPPVALVFLLLLLALCASNFLIVSDLAIKPVVVILLAFILWGLLVAVLVVSSTLMGIALPWKQGTRLLSLAAMPLLLKLAGGEALAAATSLSPFLFTAGPALALPAAPWWMYRIDFYELWAVLLLIVQLRRQPRSSVGKALCVTLLVWAAGIFMAFTLQRVNG